MGAFGNQILCIDPTCTCTEFTLKHTVTRSIRCLWQLPNLVGKELQKLPDSCNQQGTQTAVTGWSTKNALSFLRRFWWLWKLHTPTLFKYVQLSPSLLAKGWPWNEIVRRGGRTCANEGQNAMMLHDDPLTSADNLQQKQDLKTSQKS